MELNKTYNYHTEIRGTAKVQTMKSDYVIEIENELEFLGVSQDSGDERYRIKETAYTLQQYEDPIMVQITELTNRVASIYKDLVVEVNTHGKLKNIVNRSEVIQKWQDVKSWLTNTHPLESFEIIRAKEYELSNSEMEIKNVQYIYFLHQFFYLHNRHKRNTDGIRMFSRSEMDRFGAGIVLPVSVRYKTEKSDINEQEVSTSFKTILVKDTNVIQRLSRFANEKLYEPKFKIVGDYKYKENVLEKSDMTVTEELGKNYYNHSFFQLKRMN